jgi:ATP-binding cassette subfamily B protein
MINSSKQKSIYVTLKRLSKYFRPNKFFLILVVILSGLSGLAGIAGSYLLRPIINNYILPGDVAGLRTAVIVLIVMYLTGVLFTFLSNQIMVKITQKIIFELRKDLFHHVDSLPLSYFDSNSDGNVMSYFTNDIDTVENALNTCFSLMAQSFITILGSAVMMFVLNIPLTFFTVICLVAMVFVIYYNGKKSKTYFSKRQKHTATLNGFIKEMIEGQKVEKVFGREAKNIKNFRVFNNDLRVASTNAFTYSSIMGPMVVSIGFINYTFTVCAGGFMVIKNLLDLGTLASYLIFVRQFSVPANQFTQQINLFLAGIAGAERILNVFDKESEQDEGTVLLTNARIDDHGKYVKTDKVTGNFGWEIPGNRDLIPVRGEVKFHDVVFGYDSSRKILNEINMYAKPGQKIAFVGATGAGKTTIINLINRFYDIQSGIITYDGIDIKEIKKKDLRTSLALVLQDTHLFTGTITENIRYGNLSATADDVIKAAKLSNADSFIRRLPMGYDTMLKNDGDNLSLGQRQLLAVARAAVANPPVLILDEATSSIDTRTEKLLEEGMDAIMENKTVFVIAHRLSTVRNANVILVLDQGEIVERGNHEELLAQKGRYYELYTGAKQLV